MRVYCCLFARLVIYLLHFFAGNDGLEEIERIFRVSEALPSGHQVGFIYGRDAEPPPLDRQNYYVVFLDQNSDAEKILRVDDRTGEVWLRHGQQLDFEREQRLQFLAIPVDGQPTIKVTIEVQDENDNAPKFPLDVIRLNVSEYARINTELALLLARDLDTGQFGVQKYRIMAGNLNNAFRLSYNPTLYLDLVVNGRLDREYRSRYELRVDAFDGGQPPRSASLSVIVDVLDANDNAPEFLQTTYTAKIGPETAPGVPIIKLSARDPDEGENGRVSYILGSGDAFSQLFQLDPTSGVLSLASPLPANKSLPEAFDLVVTARDAGNPSLEFSSFSPNKKHLFWASVRAKIFVESRRESERGLAAPTSARLLIVWLTDDGLPRLLENTPVGSLVSRLQISASSSAIDERSLNLSLSPTTGAELFCLSATNSTNVWLLAVCGPLDREAYSVAGVQLNFIVKNPHRQDEREEGQVLLEQSAFVELLDENDNAPRWNQTQWTVDVQDIMNGFVRFLAFDADSGENGRVKYSVEATSEFGIDPDTGTLHFLASLNDNNREFDADDELCPIDPPSLTSSSPVNSSKTTQFRIRAEDHGVPKPLASTTEVLVTFSSGRPASTTTPGAETQLHFRKTQYTTSIVPTNVAVGACLFQVEAFVSGAGGSCANAPNSPRTAIRYAFVEFTEEHAKRNPFTKLFDLDSTSGRICLRKNVSAGDVASSLLQAVVVARLKVVDDETSSTAATSDELLRRNDEGPSAEALITVIVQSIFDSKPIQFSPQNYSVVLVEAPRAARSADLSGVLLQVHATGTFSSSLEYVVNGDDSRWFRVDPRNGEVRLNPSTANEVLHAGFLSTFTVRARKRDVKKEGEGKEASALVHVRTVAASDACVAFARPIFEFSVAEDVLPGIAVGEIELLDDMPPEKFYFELSPDDLGENSKADAFAFDENHSNKLLVVKELDTDERERTGGGDGETLLINVRVTRRESNRPCVNFTQVLVRIEDVNDNVPEFLVPRVLTELPEDFPLHQPFFTVRAVDIDQNENAQIEYDLIESDPRSPVFLNAESGELTLITPLDAETQDFYQISIRAQDRGVPPRHSLESFELQIRVLDVNDHTPMFSQSSYKIKIPEDTHPSTATPIFRFVAKDADISRENNRIRFKLLSFAADDSPDSATNTFQLNSRTGKLFLIAALDRELRASHSFAVEARDNGRPSRSTNATVTIRVLDVNDNGPRCTSLAQPVPIRLHAQMAAGERLARIMFDDPDEAENGTVRVRLQSPHQYFDLSPDGDLLLHQFPANLNADQSASASAESAANGESAPHELLHLSVVAEDQNVATPRSCVCDVQLNVSIEQHAFEQAISPSVLPALDAVVVSGQNTRVSPTLTTPRDEGCVYQVQMKASRLVNMLLDPTEHALSRRPIFVVPPIVATSLFPLNSNQTTNLNRSENSSPSLSSMNASTLAATDAELNSLFYYKFQHPSSSFAEHSAAMDAIFELDEWSGAVHLVDPATLLIAIIRRINETTRSTPAVERESEHAFPQTLTLAPVNVSFMLQIRRFWLRDPSPELWSFTDAFAEDERLKLSTLRVLVESDASVLTPRFAHALQTFRVNESTPEGALIGRLELAWPPPAIGCVKFGIVEEEGGQDRDEDALSSFASASLFRVEAANGALFLKKPMNFMLAKRHVFVVEANFAMDFEAEDRQGNRRAFASPALARAPRCVVIVEVEQDLTRHPIRFRSASNATLFLANYLSPDSSALSDNATTSFHYFVARSEGSTAQPKFEIRRDEDERGNDDVVAGDDAFFVNPQNGAIFVRNRTLLERLRQQAYIRLRVRASLDEMTFAEQAFTVIVDRTGLRSSYFAARQRTVSVEKRLKPGMELVDLRRKHSSENDDPRMEFRLFCATEEDAAMFVIGADDGVLHVAATSPKSGETLLESGGTHSMIVFVKQNETSSSIPSHSKPANSKLASWDHMELNVVVKNGSELATHKSPKIAQSSCGNVTVRENVAISNILRVILLEDSVHRYSRGNPNISFRIEGGSGAGRFSINKQTGDLACAPLDREANAEHLLIISASDLGSTPVKADVCAVNVIVADENDNAPEFVADSVPAEIIIGPHSNVSQVLAQFQARDPDEGANGVVRYVLAADRSGMLDLNPNSGKLTFARILSNSSALRDWTITVWAIDSGTSRQHHSERNIRVAWRRVDGPDAVEVSAFDFLQRHFTASVAEGETRGKFVAQLQTTADFCTNGSSAIQLGGGVGFSVIAGNQDQAFELDATGKLFTALELDFEIASSYRLKVLATSVGGEVAEAYVNVCVLDRNDNPPSLPAHVKPALVSEMAPVGTQIGFVQATDVDSDVQIEYEIVGADKDDEHFPFHINRFTGALHLVWLVDFEAQRSHTFRVRANDGVHSAFTNVTIFVKDENDHAPQFRHNFIEFEMKEPFAADGGPVTIAKLDARDEDSDENGRVVYTLVEPEAAKQWARMNRRTGELFVSSPEKMLAAIGNGTLVFLRLKAEDAGVPSRHSLATVLLHRRSRIAELRGGVAMPRFARANHSFVVAEDMPAFLPIGRLDVESRGSKEAAIDCAFSIRQQKAAKESVGKTLRPLNETFRVDQSGALFLIRMLDKEDPSDDEFHFQVVISACPPHSTSVLFEAQQQQAATTNVRIQVQDVNDNAPVFASQSPEIRVSQDTRRGALVARIVASDADASAENSRLRFGVLAGDEFGLVRSGGDTGQLTLDHWDPLFPLRLLLAGGDERGAELVLSARDNGLPEQRAELRTWLGLDFAAWHGLAPRFPLQVYRKVVSSSYAALANSTLVTLRPVNLWRPESRKGWRCSTSSLGSRGENIPFEQFVDAANCSFVLVRDAKTGIENLMQVAFPHPVMKFNVSVQDDRSRGSAAVVEAIVVGADEHTPQFSRPSYTFKIRYPLRLGAAFGRVLATDADHQKAGGGVGGAVRYELLQSDSSSGQSFVEIHPRTGVLRVAREAARRGDHWVERVTVLAGPPVSDFVEIAKQRQATAIVYIEIGDGFAEAVLDDAEFAIDSSTGYPSESMIDPLISFVTSRKVAFFAAIFVLGLFLLLTFVIAFVVIRSRNFARNLPKKDGPTGDRIFVDSDRKIPFSISACRKREQQMLNESGNRRHHFHSCSSNSNAKNGCGTAPRNGFGATGSLAHQSGHAFSSSSSTNIVCAPKLSVASNNYVNMNSTPPLNSAGSRESQPDSGVHFGGVSGGCGDSLSASSSTGGGQQTRLADEFLARLGIPPSDSSAEEYDDQGSTARGASLEGGTGPLSLRDLKKRAEEYQKRVNQPPATREDELLQELIYMPLCDILPLEPGEEFQLGSSLTDEFPPPPKPSLGVGLLLGLDSQGLKIPSVSEVLREEMLRFRQQPRECDV